MLRGIYGYVGSGKNIISVIDAKFTPKEVPIYTNFQLNLKNAERIEPEEVFECFEEDSKTPVKKLITDEAYTWFESRGSGITDLNKFLSYLMFQSRKRGLNWESIAQLRNTLDLRWRGMEDSIIYAHERNLDATGNSTDDFVYTVFKNMRKKTFKLKYVKAIPFFSLYNTKQVILPPEFKELQIKMKNRNPEEMNKHIDKLVLKVMEYPLPTKLLADGTRKYAITQEWCRDILMRIGTGWEFSSYVKVRIQNILTEKGELPDEPEKKKK